MLKTRKKPATEEYDYEDDEDEKRDSSKYIKE